jgi:hypothetical protein
MVNEQLPVDVISPMFTPILSSEAVCCLYVILAVTSLSVVASPDGWLLTGVLLLLVVVSEDFEVLAGALELSVFVLLLSANGPE